MAGPIETGTWVEICRVVLAAGERAPRVPPETQQVPLEMRVRGFLAAPSAIGAEAEIETVAGRRLHGTVVVAEPAYTHGFGPPVPELAVIAGAVRMLLSPRHDPTAIEGKPVTDD